MNSDEHDDSPPKFTKKSDVYAFGMTFLEVWFCQFRYESISDIFCRFSQGWFLLARWMTVQLDFMSMAAVDQNCRLRWRNITAGSSRTAGPPSLKVGLQRGKYGNGCRQDHPNNVGDTHLLPYNGMGEHHDPRSDGATLDKV